MAPQMTTKGLADQGSLKGQKFIEQDGLKRPICNRCANGKHPYSKCKTREWEWAGHSDADAEELEKDHRKRYVEELFNIRSYEAKEKFIAGGTHRKGTNPSSTASAQGRPSSNAGAVDNSAPQNAPVPCEDPSDSVRDLQDATPSKIPAATTIPHAGFPSGPGQAPLPTDSPQPAARSQAAAPQSAPSEPCSPSGPVPVHAASARSSAGGKAFHSAPAGGLGLSQQGSGPASGGKEKPASAEDTLKYSNFSKLTDATYAPPQPAGGQGQKLLIRTNFFEIERLPDKVYRYDITYAQVHGREVKNKELKIKIITDLLTRPPFVAHRLHLATDWNSLLISTQQLYSNKEEAAGTETPYLVTIANQSQQHQVKIKCVPTQQPIELDNYVNRAQYLECSEVITTLNILSQDAVADPNNNYVPVGRGRYFEKLTAADESLPHGKPPEAWKFGLHLRRGFVYSVRPGSGKPLLNINVAATAFHDRMLLIDLIRLYFPSSVKDDKELKVDEKKDLGALICGLRARLTYIPPDHTTDKKARGTLLAANQIQISGRSKRMNTLGNTVARQLFYHHGHGRSLSVQEHFNNHVLPPDESLQHPNLPAINVGGVNADDQVWIPPELLWIEPHQPIRGKLPKSLVSLMINFARRRPDVNAGNITATGISILRVHNMLNNYGLRIRDRQANSTATPDGMIRLEGRFLSAPELRYYRSTLGDSHKQGQWMLTGKRLLQVNPMALPALDVIRVGSSEGDLQTSCGRLASAFRRYGIAVAPNPTIHVAKSSTANTWDLNQALQQLSRDPSLIFVVIEGYDTWAYASIKRWGDAIVGIPTIVITTGKLRNKCEIRNDGGFQANIALKVNIKLKGKNHSLNPAAYRILCDASGVSTTMVVGADVTHPGVGSLPHCPSIAAVVASIDAQHTIYPGSVRLQASRQEIIEELDKMIAERLRCWKKNNKGQLPKAILFYRDGVGKSQFALVKNLELPKVEEGCRLVGTEFGQADYKPKITLVTVTKRHQTRFYPLGHAPEQGFQGFEGNFKPGLVADTVVTSPYHFDFYLQSHRALQGTARNGHYFVLENGMNLSADELQGLTTGLSNQLGRLGRR